MKKVLSLLVSLAFVFCLVVGSAYAEGGKNRGSEGVGQTNHVNADAQGNQAP